MGSQGAATVRQGGMEWWPHQDTRHPDGSIREPAAVRGTTGADGRGRAVHAAGRGVGEGGPPRPCLGETTEKDLHSMGELPPEEGRHPDREYRGGLQEWPEADAAAGGHLRRDLT